MSARTLAVLLVDDHAVVREGYRRLLEESGRVTVVGEAADAAQAWQQLAKLSPDVIVMDIGLPGVSGIEGMRRILAQRPDARVLIFSMYEDAIFVRRALDAGAAGYLTKASAPHLLIEAVDAVACGQRYLSPDVAGTLDLTAQQPLSGREFEVLKLLVQGSSVAEIAEQLGVHPKTVANHQSTIKQKLGAGTAAQLYRIAMRMGLVPPA